MKRDLNESSSSYFEQETETISWVNGYTGFRMISLDLVLHTTN